MFYGVPHCIQVTAHTVLFNQDQQTIHYFRYAGDSISQGDLTSFCNDFQFLYRFHFMRQMTHRAGLYLIRAIDCASQDGTFVNLGSDPSVMKGGQRREPVSNNVAALLHWIAGDSRRFHKGRTYFPGVVRNFVVGSSLAAISRDLIAGSVTDFLNAFGGALTPVMVSRFYNGTRRPEPLVTDITGVWVDSTLASMSRRLIPS